MRIPKLWIQQNTGQKLYILKYDVNFHVCCNFYIINQLQFYLKFYKKLKYNYNIGYIIEDKSYIF